MVVTGHAIKTQGRKEGTGWGSASSAVLAPPHVSRVELVAESKPPLEKENQLKQGIELWTLRMTVGRPSIVPWGNC